MLQQLLRRSSTNPLPGIDLGVAHETPELGYIEASSFYSVTLVIRADFTVRESV
jgi:hypothetical protein